MRRIFYGWWIVSAYFTISFYVGGVVITGFTAFFEPIVKEFGWSYTQISIATSRRTFRTLSGLIRIPCSVASLFVKWVSLKETY